jgi:hypothetical protein
VPDSGCFVAVPTLDEVRSILQGSWLLMCGGSNTEVTAQAIVRQLAPQAWEVRCAPPASLPVGYGPRLWSASLWRSGACHRLDPTVCAQRKAAGRSHAFAHAHSDPAPPPACGLGFIVPLPTAWIASSITCHPAQLWIRERLQCAGKSCCGPQPW